MEKEEIIRAIERFIGEASSYAYDYRIKEYGGYINEYEREEVYIRVLEGEAYHDLFYISIRFGDGFRHLSSFVNVDYVNRIRFQFYGDKFVMYAGDRVSFTLYYDEIERAFVHYSGDNVILRIELKGGHVISVVR